MGCLLFRRVEHSPRSRRKRVKKRYKSGMRNIMSKFPYRFQPVKPLKRIYIPIEKFKRRKDFTKWLERRFGGLQDGEYLLRGWKHRTRFYKKKGMGVRDFRGVFKFSIRNGRVMTVQHKIKRVRYGKHKRSGYFAIPLWFKIKDAE